MLTQNVQDSPRPFLKWAGGKSKLISQYTPYFPQDFKSYYEPFLGGGAVFFYLQSRRDAYWRTPPVKQRLQPKNAVLTDINAELINAYRCVRDNLEQLIPLLENHSLRHSKDYYYQVRSHLGTTEVEKAARLIYLNKTCFNGLYRENSKGLFNVPIGKYKNPTICNSNLLHSVSAVLQSAQIEFRPFEAVIDYAKSDDFVYFDPPYYPISPTSNFTAYSSYSFNEHEQIKLKNVFVELAERGTKVMLSNSNCSFIRELYKNFKLYEIFALRAINSNAEKRGTITEVLVTSY